MIFQEREILINLSILAVLFCSTRCFKSKYIYDQEMLQSQTTDQLTAPRGREQNIKIHMTARTQSTLLLCLVVFVALIVCGVLFCTAAHKVISSFLFLQPCYHLLGKGCPLGFLVFCVSFVFVTFPLMTWCPGSGVVLDCIYS